MVSGVCYQQRRDSACGDALRQQRSSHRGILLQGIGAGAAPSHRHRSARCQRDSLDQGIAGRLMKAQPAGAGGAGKKASNMSVYTVHVPPATAQTAPDPGRFVFVRDGFSFWAFLLGPVWMLWHGMWLVLVGYVVVVLLLQVGLHLIGASAAVKFVAGLLLALLIGFEAASLRRFKLARRRWKDAGIVVGDDT